ncbi:hypothetical protein CHS0354_042398 [Potamilus streckersoni]|uniref:Uncharacterized protein n=1 Tax=Potamilus streckersoni TaxID=2493646 RepID=A0AAE0SUA9_9BIVA|nr:hypothetical protein CHS0354_042398 [Potamilus streckersoni]
MIRFISLFTHKIGKILETYLNLFVCLNAIVTVDNPSAGKSVSVGSHAGGGANVANTGSITSNVDLSSLAGINVVNGPGAGGSFNLADVNTVLQGQAGQENGALVGGPLAVISFDASNGLPDGVFSTNFVDLGIGHGNNGGVGIDLAGHGIGGNQGAIGIEVNGGGHGIGASHNGVSVDLGGHSIGGGHGGHGDIGVDIGGSLGIGHGSGGKTGGNTAVDIHIGSSKQHGRSGHGNQGVNHVVSIYATCQ